MFSAWAKSWGFSWAASWGQVAAEVVGGSAGRKKLKLRKAPPAAVWTPYAITVPDPLLIIKKRRRKEAEFMAITLF